MTYLYSSRFLLVPLFLFHCLTFSQNTETHLNLDKNNLAVSGYDLVAYFDTKAIKGSSKFELTYDGGIYRFHNQKNKLLFEENPVKYLPQYGGWCAYAMGYNGEKVSINPESFSIENGKLYLFYKTFFNDTKTKWLENTKVLKEKADENWNNYITNEN